MIRTVLSHGAAVLLVSAAGSGLRSNRLAEIGSDVSALLLVELSWLAAIPTGAVVGAVLVARLGAAWALAAGALLLALAGLQPLASGSWAAFVVGAAASGVATACALTGAFCGVAMATDGPRRPLGIGALLMAGTLAAALGAAFATALLTIVAAVALVAAGLVTRRDGVPPRASWPGPLAALIAGATLTLGVAGLVGSSDLVALVWIGGTDAPSALVRLAAAGIGVAALASGGLVLAGPARGRGMTAALVAILATLAIAAAASTFAAAGGVPLDSIAVVFATGWIAALLGIGVAAWGLRRGWRPSLVGAAGAVLVVAALGVLAPAASPAFVVVGAAAAASALGSALVAVTARTIVADAPPQALPGLTAASVVAALVAPPVGALTAGSIVGLGVDVPHVVVGAVVAGAAIVASARLPDRNPAPAVA